jgi:predicted amidohydrolase
VAELDDGEGVILADIDTERLTRIRTDMPVLEHRRLGPPGAR